MRQPIPSCTALTSGNKRLFLLMTAGVVFTLFYYSKFGFTINLSVLPPEWLSSKATIITEKTSSTNSKSNTTKGSTLNVSTNVPTVKNGGAIKKYEKTTMKTTTKAPVSKTKISTTATKKKPDSQTPIHTSSTKAPVSKTKISTTATKKKPDSQTPIHTSSTKAPVSKTKISTTATKKKPDSQTPIHTSSTKSPVSKTKISTTATKKKPDSQTPIHTSSTKAPVSKTKISTTATKKKPDSQTPIHTSSTKSPVSKTKISTTISSTTATKKKPDSKTHIHTSSTKAPVSKNNASISCPFLSVDPFDPAIMKHISRNKRPIDCTKGNPKSLVYLDGDFLRINMTKVNQTVGNIDYCKYTAVEFSDKDDSHLRPEKWSKKFLKDPIQLSPTDEHLRIECYSNNKLRGETYISRIIEKPEREKKYESNLKRHIQENSPLETMNVLIVGIDGMSKQNLIRTMPKTRNFIINNLKAKELNKFNKVGDNTFPNVIALHTGKSEAENRKKWNNKAYFDVLEEDFIWHHYQKAGYRTSMVLDVTYITAYHYLKKGWKKPTFDYYSRPLSLKMYQNNKRVRRYDRNCIGDVPEMVILQDYILQLTRKFNDSRTKPYFAYSFFTYLSHDNQNEAARGDNIFFDFFQQLDQTKALNNTVVLFFSDHGTRFGSFRHTFNGKIEINTPFAFLIFPPWFEKKYPELMTALSINQNRLTSFFDLNKTFMDLLNFKGKTKKGNIESRGISLFDEIPKERTCSHAGVPITFCNCKSLSNETIPKQTSDDIAKQLLELILKITSEKREICAILSLKYVISILAIHSKTHAKDALYYQTTIETSPGGGVYEALMKYDVSKRKASLVGKIVRLNLYKGQDGCVETLTLKPYCYCKK